MSNQLQSNLHAKPVFSQSGNTNAMVKETTTALSNQMSHNNVGLRRSSRLFSHASGSSVKVLTQCLYYNFIILKVIRSRKCELMQWSRTCILEG